MGIINTSRVVELRELAGIVRLPPEWMKRSFDSVASFGEGVRSSLSFYDGPELDVATYSAARGLILLPERLSGRYKDQTSEACYAFVRDPRADFIEIVNHCIQSNVSFIPDNFPKKPSVSKHVDIGLNVIIEEGVQIDDNVRIGHGSIIHSGTWLKSGVSIGANSVVGGVGVNLHTNIDSGTRYRFPHLAGVILGERASIGANCVVVKGILSSTLIESEVIIGNLCNVGHCCTLHKGVWLSSNVAVGGYCSVGEYTNIAIGVTLKNGLTVGSGCNIGMGSVVTKSVDDRVSVFGNPARKIAGIIAGPNIL